MGTIKELNSEIGETILFYIVENGIKDPGAIKILLEHVQRNSEKFVRDYLEEILPEEL